MSELLQGSMVDLPATGGGVRRRRKESREYIGGIAGGGGTRSRVSRVFAPPQSSSSSSLSLSLAPNPPPPLLQIGDSEGDRETVVDPNSVGPIQLFLTGVRAFSSTALLQKKRDLDIYIYIVMGTPPPGEADSPFPIN